ncbi:MAG: DUF423 domain-containing protein [Acidobacteria bacterium]|nr:DUF423 domain-containing protein [Acidobacteriota bacterium]
MGRIFFVLGSLSGALGVAAGAFAAHALKDRLTPERLNIFEIGARYHLIHALALLATAWAASRWPGSATSAAGWLFIIGTVLFSGSLYALSLSGIRVLGAITPFGGVAFIAAWLALGWAAWQGK